MPLLRCGLALVKGQSMKFGERPNVICWTSPNSMTSAVQYFFQILLSPESTANLDDAGEHRVVIIALSQRGNRHYLQRKLPNPNSPSSTPNTLAPRHTQSSVELGLQGDRSRDPRWDCLPLAATSMDQHKAPSVSLRTQHLLHTYIYIHIGT